MCVCVCVCVCKSSNGYWTEYSRHFPRHGSEAPPSSMLFVVS